MCVDKFFESDRLASIHASTHLVYFEPVFVARHKKKFGLCAHSSLKTRALFVFLHIIIRGRLCIFYPNVLK